MVLMKSGSFRITFLLALCLVLYGSGAKSQWIQSQGMEGASLYCVLATDSLVFITGSGQGISKRNINLGSWHIVLPYNQNAIIKAGNYIIGYTGYSMYRSSDRGQTWDSVIYFPHFAERLVSVDTTLFMSNVQDIQRSDDYGDTWYSVQNNIPQIDLGLIFANNASLFYFDLGLDLLYRSDNLGIQWTEIPLSGMIYNGFSGIKDIYKYQSVIWASASGIFRYNDTIQSWIQVNDTLSFSHFGEYHNELYGCWPGVYNFNLAQNTWVEKSEGLNNQTVTDISSTDSLFFCTTSSGFYKTNDSLIWHPDNPGLNGAGIYYVAVRGNEVWVCTSLGLFTSSNGGISMTKRTFPGSRNPTKVFLTDSVYYLTDNYSLYRSWDFGNTWTAIALPVTASSQFPDVAFGSQYIFILNSMSIYRSPYNPIEWEQVQESMTYLAAIEAHEQTFVAGTQGSSQIHYPLVLSHDNGNTLDTLYEYDFGYFPFIKFVDDRFITGEDLRLLVSGDDGFTWDEIVIQVNDYFNVMDCSSDCDILVVSGFDYYPYIGAVFISYNYGTDWLKITDNLLNYGSRSFGKIEIAGNRILLGTDGNGLFYRDDLLTGIRSEKPKNPRRILISPNPASSHVKFALNPEEQTEGRFLLTDLMGRTVYDSGPVRPGKGRNTITVNTDYFSDGLYIVSWISDHSHYSGKLQVVH
jgi:hypothetical protein